MKNCLNQKLSILRLNIYISQFPAPSIGTVFHVTGGISFLEPRIWNFLPEKFKSTHSLENFLNH